MTPSLSIALDVSPLFHTTTSGIATYLIELMQNLPLVDEDDRFNWFYCSPWRAGRRRFPVTRPRDGRVRVPPLPPRLLELGWKSFGQPSIQLLAGRPHIYHATPLWEPPLGRARPVMTFHDLTPIVMPEVHVQANVESHRHAIQFARRHGAGILVDSEATRRDLLSVAPDLGPRTHVVYLSASEDFRPMEDPSESQRTLQPLGLTDTAYFLFTGTLEPRKNLSRLLAAFAAVESAESDAPRLVLAGPTGWGDLELPAQARRLGIDERLIMAGRVSRVTLRALMAGAVALVYPSLYEGFGIPPLEAMRCGTPVITSNVSSLPEVVGDAALLIDPLDVDALGEAMQTVLTSPSLRAELRRLGLERAQKFSWQATARATADFYHLVHQGL